MQQDRDFFVWCYIIERAWCASRPPQHLAVDLLTHYIILISDLSARGCGTVVARPLCMRQVRGSIPRFSKQLSIGHVFDSRWVLTEALIAQW